MLKNLKNNLSIIVLGLIHTLFFALIAAPEWGWKLLLAAPIILSYFLFDNKLQWNWKHLILQILTFGIGLYATQLLQSTFRFNPIMAAGIVGILGAFTMNKIDETTPAANYAGAFAGMSSVLYFETPKDFLTATLIGGIIFHLISKSFNGLGGKLGSIGFAAASVTLLLKWM